MKYIGTLSVRIVVAIFVGFLLAGASTKITYTCPPVDGDVGCVSFEKAVMHLGDLMSNKQDSLVHFSTTFVIATVIVFTLLSVLAWARKRKVS